MNPEYLVEKLPQVGRAINIIALATIICAVGLAATNNEEAAVFLKSVHGGLTLIAGLIAGLDTGINAGLMKQGYSISNKDGWANPVRIQNLILTGGNIFLNIISQNSK